MLFRDTVEFAHMVPGLAPEIMDIIYVIVAVSEQLGMIDAKVVEV